MFNDILNDKYNYSLNGIEHEIILNESLKIDQKPLNDKILISNKYLIKYINDLFDFHNIEYCLTGNSLLGANLFKGINIFNSKLEIFILDINLYKLKKLEDEIKKDGFDIIFNDNYIKISIIFFDKIKCYIIIYLLENIKDNDNDLLRYINLDKESNIYQFYDIYPIKKTKFEEFEVSVPNKIENILNSYKIHLNYISFTNNKKNNNKKIIEENDDKLIINHIIKDNISTFISVIKPFFQNL